MSHVCSKSESRISFASSGSIPELAAAATELEVLPSVHVPIATLGHLLALKALAMDDAARPQDRIDILGLLKHADEQEIARAQEAIALLTARGFKRKSQKLSGAVVQSDRISTQASSGIRGGALFVGTQEYDQGALHQPYLVGAAFG